MPRLKRVKHDFFDTWSREMAYVLGFIFADGYVHTNKRGSRYLGFVSTDKELVEGIRNLLESNHKISSRPSAKKNHKPLYRLQIGSAHMIDTLDGYGIFQNKSLVARFPKNVPQECLGDFIRGYFDGDGCVYFKEHFAKDRNKKRWVFQTKFISGSRLFLSDLARELSPYTAGGFMTKKAKGFELLFSHRDSRVLYDFMYANTSKKLFLKRKKEKFQVALRVLSL